MSQFHLRYQIQIRVFRGCVARDEANRSYRFAHPQLLRSPNYIRFVVSPGLVHFFADLASTPLAVSSTDEGDERRTCIDGKQRLTSIQRSVLSTPIRKYQHCSSP